MSAPEKPLRAARPVFDPGLCPLLDGLTPEEQAERMESDPIIRACVRKLEASGEQTSGCRVARAYASRRRNAFADGG